MPNRPNEGESPKGFTARKAIFVKPMYARLVHELPQGNEWLYEVKFDGYRCLAGRDSVRPVLWSRKGKLLTTQFPNIAHACERLVPNTLMDGEIVALDEDGRIAFSLLQHHRSNAQALRFYAVDLLIYRGRSLLKLPLEARRKLLSQILKGIVSNVRAPIRFSESIEANPADLMRIAKQFGLEGIIGKRKDSCYESGERSGAWVKYKINRSQEFVIGGYTAGNPFGSLIVGYYEDSRLFYVANVRNGFVPRVRYELWRNFSGLRIDTCPFANLPETKRTRWALTKEEMKKCRWLIPELVAQLEFTEWTPDGHLRHTKFSGLRDAKNARDVRGKG